ncbi:MAG: TIGR00730 family Rossman fold protein [Bacteriovoracaceae bacterium]
MIKSLAVFCGSRTGTKPIYMETAYKLGKILAEKKIKLVYGGAQIGIMGEVARAALENSGEVLGVIPRSLQTREITEQRCTELKVVDSMHDRKMIMYDHSDAFVALPGGPGTMDEFFEIYTWSQLGFHQKKCFVLNVDGYYDHLIAHFNQMTEKGFMSQEDLERVRFVESIEEVFVLTGHGPIIR